MYFWLYLISLVLIICNYNDWFLVPWWTVAVSWLVFLVFGAIHAHAKGSMEGLEIAINKHLDKENK